MRMLGGQTFSARSCSVLHGVKTITKPLSQIFANGVTYRRHRVAFSEDVLSLSSSFFYLPFG